MQQLSTGDLVRLNVGGRLFTTSKQTLLSLPNTFFASLLSGRIESSRDESGAIFIDRDPALFSIVLNYLRCNYLDVSHLSTQHVKAVLHEAEFYGVAPLVAKLSLCVHAFESPCGGLLFHCYIPPPAKQQITQHQQPTRQGNANSQAEHPESQAAAVGTKADGEVEASRVTMLRCHHHWIVVVFSHEFRCYRLKETSGWYLVWVSPRLPAVIERIALNAKAQLPASTLGLAPPSANAANAGVVGAANGNGNVNANVNAGVNANAQAAPLVGLAAAPAPNVANSNASTNGATNTATAAASKLVAVASGSGVRIWCVTERDAREIGAFDLGAHVDMLLFVGPQVVAIAQAAGRIGVWHRSQTWTVQELATPISSYDVAGLEYLLLGCSNGAICYIDMQKFPLRMKDNEVLVTELYRDPQGQEVTALSVYLTPKTSISAGNWIEIAYGTACGVVRIVVQHPETVGHGPQLFQTFTVHQARVTKVMLSEKYLVSVCADQNHVRTWSVTRFRGMISTQPGSTPLASFKILTLDDASLHVDAHVHPATWTHGLRPREAASYYDAGNDYGIFGDKDDHQLFVQKLAPFTDQLYVRLASDGRRICTVRSVDGSAISSFTVHEFDSSSRLGARARKFLLTGHTDGSVQMWDLTTALEQLQRPAGSVSDPATATDLAAAPITPYSHVAIPYAHGGPLPGEIMLELRNCDVRGSASCVVSPSVSFAQLNTLAGATSCHPAATCSARARLIAAEPPSADFTRFDPRLSAGETSRCESVAPATFGSRYEQLRYIDNSRSGECDSSDAEMCDSARVSDTAAGTGKDRLSRSIK